MKMQHSILIFSISTFFPFPPQLTPITQIKRKYNAALLNLFNPSGVAGHRCAVGHGFHPRLLTFKPFGLWQAFQIFFMLNFRAASQGCPYIPSSPDPINLDYQTLHALRPSLRDRSPHLIFLPSHPLLFVLHSQFSTSFFHSQLSVLNSSLLVLHS